MATLPLRHSQNGLQLDHFETLYYLIDSIITSPTMAIGTAHRILSPSEEADSVIVSFDNRSTQVESFTNGISEMYPLGIK